MSTNVVLALTAGLLFGAGVYLLMARGIVRAFLGVLLMGNGINLLFLLASGAAGRAPVVVGGDTSQAGMADPLPQALVLTAIVITVAMTGYVLALAYRSTRTVATDAIQDDAEDALLATRTIAEDSEVDTIEEPDGDDDVAPAQTPAPRPGATRAEPGDAPDVMGRSDR